MVSVTGEADRESLADPTWRPLYAAGGVAAGIAVVLYVVALALFIATPEPPMPDAGGAAMLEHVAANETTYVVKQILWIAPSLAMMVVALALAVALAPLNKSHALIAGVIGVSSWALSFAWPTTGEGSLAMVVLSRRYAEAAPGAERAAFVAGAELLIALNDLPAVVLGVVQAFGVLLLSVLMTRGVSPRGLAWLGVATGLLGLVSEALRPALGWAYAVYGLALFVWLIWVALALWRLGDNPNVRVNSAGAT